MDLATFRIRFPEFQNVPDAYVTPVLAQAALELRVDLFGNLLPEAIGFLTAHKLAMSPWGSAVRIMVKEKPTTTYWAHLDEMKKSLVGFVVL